MVWMGGYWADTGQILGGYNSFCWVTGADSFGIYSWILGRLLSGFWVSKLADV